MSAADGWTPAFPGQRPPFQPGHELSTRHGAYSPRKVDPLAADLVAQVDADSAVTWLTAADRPALWAWAKDEARAQLLEEYLAGLAEAEGADLADLDLSRVQSAYRELHRASTRAASRRSELGLTPLSRARLGRDVAAAQHFDVARAMADLHRAEQERLSAESERVDGEGGDEE